MHTESIDTLRHVSRKLVRELGMLQLNKAQPKETPEQWHALIEIAKDPTITISKLGRLLLLSMSSVSRLVAALTKEGLVVLKEGKDRREKSLQLTEKGVLTLQKIDDFSNTKIKGAFEFLSEEEQKRIIEAISLYGDALEKSRRKHEHVKLHTLPTSRSLRKQIVSMIEHIQKNEFSLPITPDINASVLKAEEEFYYHNAYNFWYAVDEEGHVIGSIGLKKLDDGCGEVKKFFVAKSYRGKGIAQKLMRTLLKAAGSHGFQFLVLGTVATLEAAHGFYKKSGFQQVKLEELPDGFVICPLDSVFFRGNVENLCDAMDLRCAVSVRKGMR